MSFTKYNNSNNPFASLEIKLEEIENTITCEQLTKEGNVMRVIAIMFSTKGEYGKSAFLILADDHDITYTMWLPSHLVDTCEAILADTTDVEAILSAKCGVKGREYKDKKGITRYTVEWVDL